MGCLFDHVAVTKPSPSKPGNSETYVIGKGYRGASPDLLSLLLHHVSTEDMFKSRAMFGQEVLGSSSFMRSAELAASAFAGSSLASFYKCMLCKDEEHWSGYGNEWMFISACTQVVHTMIGVCAPGETKYI
eukprot:scaffold30910_cov18-Tisochrysis_lutea.AAC.2